MDLRKLRKAFEKRDEAAFEREIAELGIDLDFPSFWKTCSQFGGFQATKIAQNLVVLANTALHTPHGYGESDWSAWWLFAVKLDDRLVFGISKRPPAKRWYKDPAKNRPAIEAWARAAKGEKYSFAKIVKPVAPATDDRGAALLAAVIAAPEDQAARLVYADWLIEQGDVRGEMLRLHAAGKTKRLEQLHKLHRNALHAPIAGFVHSSSVASGLVESISADAPKLVTHASALFDKHPITIVSIYASSAAEVAKLATIGSRLGRMTKLRLEQRKKGHILPSALARAGAFASVHTLRIEKLDETPAEWRKFFAALGAPHLVSLRHAYVRSGPSAVEIATQLGKLAGLGTLAIDSWDIGDRMLDVATALLASRSITDLAIEYCSWSPDALLAFARLPALRRLKRFTLAGDQATLPAIAQFIRKAPLRELTLVNLGWEPARTYEPIVEALVAAPASLAKVTWIGSPHTREQLARIRAKRTLEARDEP